MEKVISPKYRRATGKDIWREQLHLAIYAADKIRSTLGPRGSYKLISYNRGPEKVIKITKDAVAILDELAIQYPPAVIVSEAAKLQREETGDGVATFVIFLSALLKKADELLEMGIHPNTIIHGYYLATEKSLQIIDKQATNQNIPNSTVLDIIDCKRNLITPQIYALVFEAYKTASSDGKFDKDAVRILKKTGCSVPESKLIKGIVIKKEKAHPNMPDRKENLRIAITSERPGIDRLEIKMPGQGPVHINLTIKTADQIAKYKETMEGLRADSLDKMIELKANVLICEQPLDEKLKDELIKNGIFALERVDKKDSEALAKATGAKIIAKLNEISEEDLGAASELSVGKIELESTVTFQGCKAATFMIRGTTTQATDELETGIKNSLVLLKAISSDSRVLPGGGASETHLAQELLNYSKELIGREQISIQSFAEALLDIPRCLTENYGLNSTDILPQLRKHHAEGHYGYGVNGQGCSETVCFEPISIKRSAIRRAFEVASLMLRIDELLISKEIPKFHKK